MSFLSRQGKLSPDFYIFMRDFINNWSGKCHSVCGQSYYSSLEKNWLKTVYLILYINNGFKTENGLWRRKDSSHHPIEVLWFLHDESQETCLTWLTSQACFNSWGLEWPSATFAFLAPGASCNLVKASQLYFETHHSQTLKGFKLGFLFLHRDYCLTSGW